MKVTKLSVLLVLGTAAVLSGAMSHATPVGFDDYRVIQADSNGGFAATSAAPSMAANQTLPDRLTSDLTIQGDLTLAQSLHLDGHHLTVTGNLTHSAGNLVVGAGRLTVQGNYRIQQSPAVEGGAYRPSDGRLVMGEAAGSVLVQGDFVMQSNQSHFNQLLAGVLEVMGDFTQLRTPAPNSTGNFRASRSHKVLLSGQMQQVAFETDNSYFNILEFAPGSAPSATFKTPVIVRQNLITHGQTLPSISGELTWALEQDQRIEGNLTLSGGNLNLAGRHLTVAGDLLQEDGFVIPNSGRLTIERDYRLQSAPAAAGGEYRPGNGRLDMRSTASHVLVLGDFVMQSNHSHSSLLFDGVLEVRGNFTQLRTTVPNSRFNFQSTRSHKVLLSGENQQIFFETDGSFFNTLEFASGSAPTAEFLTPITVRENLSTNGYALPRLEGTINWSFEQDQRIEGDFILTGGRLNIAGRNLTINGNLIQEDGTISLNNGRLEVAGDYRLQQRPAVENGPYRAGDGQLSMTHSADRVLVEGNFVTQSTQSHSSNLHAGVLEVQGNFSQLQATNSNSHLNFAASRSHKVVLSGQNQQVLFENDRSAFQLLEFAVGSAASVEFLSPIIVRENLITHGQALPTLSGTIHWTLDQPQHIDGDLHLVDGILNLAGRTLSVAGDLVQAGGQIRINNGSLLVDGDYRVQSMPLVEGGIFLPSDGRLQMTEATDYVRVGGDFVMQSHRSHSSLLQAGLLEVWGNFTQLRTSAFNSRLNFNASSNHRVLLAGQQEQQVEFESADSGFATLQHANPTSAVFVGSVRVTNPQQFLVQLSVSTEAGSRITSLDAELDCGDVCERFYTQGNVVVLKTSRRRNEVLADWPVDCFVNGQLCTFTVDQVRQLSFDFTKNESAKRRGSNLLKILMLAGNE